MKMSSSTTTTRALDGIIITLALIGLQVFCFMLIRGLHVMDHCKGSVESNALGFTVLFVSWIYFIVWMDGIELEVMLMLSSWIIWALFTSSQFVKIMPCV
jgi:hypothetical protein